MYVFSFQNCLSSKYYEIAMSQKLRISINFDLIVARRSVFYGSQGILSTIIVSIVDGMYACLL